MPGTTNGSGQPHTLRCSKCRQHGKDGLRLTATGNVRASTKRGLRLTDRKIQYLCRNCGFTGWTQHIDGEHLLTRFVRRLTAPLTQRTGTASGLGGWPDHG